jgi:hypothetical protein
MHDNDITSCTYKELLVSHMTCHQTQMYSFVPALIEWNRLMHDNDDNVLYIQGAAG